MPAKSINHKGISSKVLSAEYPADYPNSSKKLTTKEFLFKLDI